jgi:acetyl esterase/lipase
LETLRYGNDRAQVGDLRLPSATTAPPHPVAVLIHGGFWRMPWGRDLMDGLAEDLIARGMATWNIEYRRLGARGGGWPGTFDDVAAAIAMLSRLAEQHPLDLDRIGLVGHSAGGHLALWAAARAQTRPAAVVSLAGVVDLREASRLRLDGDAAGELVADPSRFADTSPIEMLPIGVAQLVVHGDADDRVPQSMGLRYAAAARAAGDDVELHAPHGVDHFSLIDPRSDPWRRAAAWLQGRLGIGTPGGT